MPSQSKRRRASLLSLPVVVVAGFLLVAKLAAWQQSDIVADLADCVAHGETREAMDAVRKLAAMPNPPIPVLVAAAASDEHETAEAGQVAISRLLRRWQRDIQKKHRIGAVANQLCELAQTLAEKQNDFAKSDHPWLAITTGKILKLANKLPAKRTPLVAIHCDAILAAVDAGGSVTVPGAAAADSGLATTGKIEKAPFAPAAVSSDRESGKAELERELSAYAPQPVDKGSQASGHASHIEPTTPSAPPYPANSSSTESTLKFDDEGTGAPASSGGAADDELSEHVPSRSNRLQNADWSQPIFRILPAMPIEIGSLGGRAAENMGENSRSTAQSGRPVAADGRLVGVGSRELLRRWLAVEDGDARTIERELAGRGFGKITTRMVRQYLSDDAEERMRLVNDVLARPGAGAGAWLLLLAEDSDAEVRLFAVTLMATSNDAALVEKAWRVALRDRDPRIADLAGRLRERRAGTLRR